MSIITNYNWDLGNGETSSSPSPVVVYGPGKYTVALSATSDTGGITEVTEVDFIVVTEDQQTLFNEKYLTDPKSFHYGTNQSVASGWSENAGDNWVWPESQAAVTHENIDGIDYLLVWDMFDDKQYCINPRESAFTNITHVDKDAHEIACSTTFKARVGESRDYQIMHQQTKVQLRNDIDTGTRPSGMTIYMSLIGEDGETLERVPLTPGREVIFKEQSVYTGGEHDSIQIKFEADKSGFLLSSYESIYKTMDKSVAATSNVLDTDTASVFADVKHWITTEGDYIVDLGTGSSITPVWNYTTGPDGVSGSSILLTSDFDIGNVEHTGTLTFWYKGTKPSIGVVTTDSVTTGGFTLSEYTGVIPANITFNLGSELFDIRILNSSTDSITISDYGTHYQKHIGVY